MIGQSLQSGEPADPVVHVHDQVANLQVPEIREERARRRSPALVDPAFLLEEIRLGEDQQRALRQVEAARELSGRDEHGGARKVVGRADGTRPDLVVGEKLDGALGAAGAGGDEDDGVAAVSGGANLVGPVADAAVVLERRHGRHVHGARAATVNLELADVVRSAQPARQVLPARRRWFRTESPNGRVRRPRTPMRATAASSATARSWMSSSSNAMTDDTRATGVVDDRGGSIERRGIIGGRDVGQQFAERTDRDAIDRDERSLGRAVEPPDGLDDVPDELEADRLRIRRRVEVDDAAADAEFAVLVHRILGREARDGEPLAKVDRGDLGSRRERQADVLETGGIAQPRQQGTSGRDDEPGSSRREAVERARPRGGDFEVRREAAIRIHFLRREGQHLREHVVLGQALERCQKQTRVGRHLLDVRVGRHHEQHGRVLRDDGRVKRRRGRRQIRSAGPWAG